MIMATGDPQPTRLVWAIAVCFAMVLLGACNAQPLVTRPVSGDTYDRVMKTGVIRCSYIVYPPYCMKDPNTGKLSGVFVEAMEQAATNLSLKAEWTEEVGYDSLFQGLETNRHDVFAGGLWPNAERARAGEFTIPIFYSAIRAYGRTDEHRFKNLDGINSSDVTIAVLDGAIEDHIARADYPKAKRFSIPQLTPFSQNLHNIVAHKADLTFAEPGMIDLFLKTNPGTLKELAPDKPVRIFGNAFVVKLGDVRFKNMLNATLDEMVNDGAVDKLLKKYEPGPNVFLRVALPYREDSTRRSVRL